MPEWKPEIRRRLARLKLEPTREAAIVEELTQHLEDCYAELLASGATPAEAECLTRAELSGSELLARELRCVERQVAPEPIILGTNRRTNMIADLWQDLRYGARMLLKQPGFTLIAVITLALGVGANTALFSVVNAVLLEALPYRDAERLVMVWEKNQRSAQNVINLGNFFDWKAQNDVFVDMATFVDFRTNLTGQGDPVEAPAQVATENLFSVLGVNPILGRTFTPEDAKQGQNNVVVLGYGLWQRQFGGDPHVIGRKIVLNNNENTVIGVLPPDFQWHIQGNSNTVLPPM